MAANGLLDRALDHHRAGRFAEAETAYAHVLAATPGDPDALHLLGVLYHQTGRANAAPGLIRQALAKRPVFPAALNSLGTVLAATGANDAAEDCLRRALDQAPAYAEAHGNLAGLLERTGRPDEALAHYRQAVAHAPDRPPVQTNLGLALRRRGRLAEAAACLRTALSLAPADADAANGLALVLRDLKQLDAALVQVRTALAQRPETPDYLFTLALIQNDRGDAAAAEQALSAVVARQPTRLEAVRPLALRLHERGDKAAAEPLLRRLLDARPDDVACLRALARDLTAQQRTAEAQPLWQRLCHLAPDDAAAHRQVGLRLSRQADGRTAAIAHLETAIRLDPSVAAPYLPLAELYLQDNRTEAAEAVLRRALDQAAAPAEAACNLAGLLIVANRLTEAQALLDRVVTEHPDLALAHRTLGRLAWQRNRPRDALEHLGTALRLDPRDGGAHLSRALVLLEQGALQVGWRDYSWRFSAKGFRDRRIGRPRWRGESAAGKRLLVWREQGLGDALMFGTCFPDLADRRLTGSLGSACVESDGRLVPLLARSLPTLTVRAESVDEAGVETEAARDCDLHTPAGDLPLLLRSTLAAFPIQPAPLLPDPHRRVQWRQRLDALGPGLKVGVCWRSQLVSSYRSGVYADLHRWQPLLRTPGCRFVSLQYDQKPEELSGFEAETGLHLARWDDLALRDDLEGVAALIAGLDLVVSAPTAVAELAGSLGVPVWRLTPARDWTRLGTTVRPWFSGMRCLSFGTASTLEQVLAQAARNLQRLARAAPPPSGQALAFGQESAPGGGLGSGASRTPRQTGRRPTDQRTADPGLLHAQAVALERQGRDAEAIAVYRQCLAHWAGAEDTGGAGQSLSETARRSLAVSLGNLGNCLLRLGRPAEALVYHERAAALLPGTASVHQNLGATLLALDRPEAAVDQHRRAVAGAPEQATGHSNLGAALERLGRLAEAESCYQAALARDPEQPDALCNLGYLLFSRGRWPEAERLYRQALERRPDFALARYNLSQLLLRTGRLADGWTAYEARFDAPILGNRRRRFGLPDWDGQPDRTVGLLVVREQGVGDELLFASLYRNAAERVGRLTVCCDERLTGLIGRLLPASATPTLLPEPRLRPRTALPAGSRLDAQIPAGSLCRLLRPTLSAFPMGSDKAEPLLTPPPDRCAAARAWLDSLAPGLRVGLAWRSSHQTHLRRQSSMPLTDWLPLLRLPDLCVISLQYDDDTAERADLAASHGVTLPKWPGVDLMEDLDSAAALAAGLDLVVSTGTAAAELAATVGTPVWRLEDANAWTFLGTECRPFFRAVRVFPIGRNRSPAAAARSVVEALQRIRQTRRRT